MSPLDFSEIFTSIEEAFGRYPKIKRERIYYFCQKLTPEQLRQICIGFIDRDEKPGVGHFKSKAQMYDRWDEIGGSILKNKISDCSHCLGSGVAWLDAADSKNHEISELIAVFCDCGCAKNYWELPKLSTVNKSGFQVVKNQQSLWEPKIKKNIQKAIEQKSELWKSRVKKSKIYWEKIAGVKN